MALSEQDPAGETSSLYRLLADPRRRHAFRVLSDARSPLALTDLATDVAARETNESRTDVAEERIMEIRISLHHCHLPYLDDRGLVDYDPERRTVAMAASDTSV